MKKIIILLVIVVAAGYWFIGRDSGPGESEQVQLDPKEVLLSGSARLEAVGDYTGSGTATRQWDGKTFVHTVETNLGDPADGKFYEGWLVRPEPFEFISTGRLQQTDNGYGLVFSMPGNLTEHINIVITEETEASGLDGIPEAHVLEGSF